MPGWRIELNQALHGLSYQSEIGENREVETRLYGYRL